jgi:hypothetical protein
MSTREYVSYAAQPVSTEEVDIYALALLAAMKVNANDNTPFLLNAALNDIIPIMRKQYEEAQIGWARYTLPNSVFLVPKSVDESILQDISEVTGAPISEIIIDPSTDYVFRPINDYAPVDAHHGSVLSIRLGLALFANHEGVYLTYDDYVAGYDPDNAYRCMEEGDSLDPSVSKIDYYSISDGYNPTYDIYQVHWYEWDEAGNFYTDHYDPQHPSDPSLAQTSEFRITIVEFTLTSSPYVRRFRVYRDDNYILFGASAFNYGSYYPIPTIKEDFTYWDDESKWDSSSINKFRRIINNYKFIDIGSVTGALKAMYEDSEDEDILDDAYVFNGVNLYSLDNMDNRYMFRFFADIAFQSEVFQSTALDDYSRSNQLSIVSDQFDITYMFRRCFHSIIDNNPDSNAVITYRHRWEDNPPSPNAVTVEHEGSSSYYTSLQYIAGEHKDWSNNKLYIDKLADEVVIETIEIWGLQLVVRITIAANQHVKIADVIPSGALEADSVDTDTVPLVLIPLDHEVLTGQGYYNYKELRSLYTKSFNFIFFGSKVEHTHWTQDLRDIVVDFIKLGAELYSIISLGSNLINIMSAHSFIDTVLAQGKKYLLQTITKIILQEVLGDELGSTVFTVGSISTSIFNTVTDVDFELNLTTSLQITQAVLTAYTAIEGYKYNKKIEDFKNQIESDLMDVQEEEQEEEKEEEKEEVTLNPVESPSEFLNRTTNGAIPKDGLKFIEIADYEAGDFKLGED